MAESSYDKIAEIADYLKLSISAEEIASCFTKLNMNQEEIDKTVEFFEILEERKKEAVVNTCLKLSRLPLTEPKTFSNFDFSYVHSNDLEKLKNLSTLSPLYEHRNLAFIGPPGIGKTHLSMAFGRACCELGNKVYFLKATELNQRLTQARKNDSVGSTTNGLVKPSCLIIDEMGRCKFDKENTRIFFDVIDRRASKEGPNCMIFTSNKSPSQWKEDFDEDDTLLCALDRIFDNAIVYMMDGKSYRGRKLETVAVKVGSTSDLLDPVKQ